jgi:hypothetical protein
MAKTLADMTEIMEHGAAIQRLSGNKDDRIEKLIKKSKRVLTEFEDWEGSNTHYKDNEPVWIVCKECGTKIKTTVSNLFSKSSLFFCNQKCYRTWIKK